MLYDRGLDMLLMYMCTIHKCTWYMHVHVLLYLCIHVHMHVYYSHRPKHPTKVHVWVGISGREKTSVVIFDGIMTAECYVNI